jgi:glycosyltransferase involved in cell wall biosynthesis
LEKENSRILVSVGVPNYNYAHHITEALDSIANQTYPDIELIIVDDCSTDNSRELITKWIQNYKGNYTIQFIKNETNLGLTKVCNIILQHAKGKYFQTLDADDVLLPDKISRQVEILEKGKNVAFVYSNIAMMDVAGHVINEDYLKDIGYDERNMPAGNIFEALFDFNFVPLPSVLINTAMAWAAGGFNEALQVQDYYLWLKLSEKHDAIFLPGNTALYRVHASSMSNSTATNPRSVESVLQIKYRYFKAATPAIRKKIKKNIHFSSVYLYEHNFPTAGLWLKRDFLLNPGVKTLGYFLAISLGIPFSFFAKIKTILS